MNWETVCPLLQRSILKWLRMLPTDTMEIQTLEQLSRIVFSEDTSKKIRFLPQRGENYVRTEVYITWLRIRADRRGHLKPCVAIPLWQPDLHRPTMADFITVIPPGVWKVLYSRPCYLPLHRLTNLRSNCLRSS